MSSIGIVSQVDQYQHVHPNALREQLGLKLMQSSAP